MNTGGRLQETRIPLQLAGDGRRVLYDVVPLTAGISLADAQAELTVLEEDGQVESDVYLPVVVDETGREMTWIAGDVAGVRAYAVRI